VIRILVVDRNPRSRAEMARLLREVGYEVLTTDVQTPAQAPTLDGADFVVIRREPDDFDDVGSIGDLERDATDLTITWLRPNEKMSLRRMTEEIAAANQQATRILAAITPAISHGRVMRRLAPGLALFQSKIWGKSS
jgi:hypothetical protein